MVAALAQWRVRTTRAHKHQWQHLQNNGQKCSAAVWLEWKTLSFARGAQTMTTKEPA
jgi:hypothetical protein